jgi:hypothetical protein
MAMITGNKLLKHKYTGDYCWAHFFKYDFDNWKATVDLAAICYRHNHNGHLKNMQTGVYYLANYCK